MQAERIHRADGRTLQQQLLAAQMQIAGVGADLLRQAGRDVGAQLGRRNLLAEADVLLDELFVERIERVDLLHVTFHNRAQRADLLFILFDLREVPRTLLLEARHQRVGAFAFEGQPGRNRVVRDAQPVVSRSSAAPGRSGSSRGRLAAARCRASAGGGCRSRAPRAPPESPKG